MAEDTPPRINIAAGLATNPGNIEEFRGTLKDGAASIAFGAAKSALETVQTSVADMSEALRLSISTKPEHRVIGLSGKVEGSVPSERKAEVVAAMSQSFRRGSKLLDDANRIIDEAAVSIEGRINSALVNNRRNETAVATTAVQIRDLIRGLPAMERIAFVRKATLEKDIEIISAVFGASPFVSGLSRAQLADLKADAEAEFAPAFVAQRAALAKVRDKIATASAVYFTKYSEMVPRADVRSTAGAEALEKLRSGKGA